MTYPPTWPGTAIIKSTHNAFAWREQPSLIPREPQQGKRGPKPAVKQATAFGTVGATMHGLSHKSDKRRETHGLPGHLVRPPSHGGAYSKASSSST